MIMTMGGDSYGRTHGNGNGFRDGYINGDGKGNGRGRRVGHGFGYGYIDGNGNGRDFDIWLPCVLVADADEESCMMVAAVEVVG